MSNAQVAIDHAAREHAIFSASTMARRRLCPGSLREELVRADPGSSYAAEWGTRCHELSEHIFKVHLSGNDGAAIAEFEEFFAKVQEDYPTSADEMHETAQAYVDYALAINEEFGGEIFIEHRFNLLWLFDEETQAKMSDYLFQDEHGVWMVKLPDGSVEPMRNLLFGTGDFINVSDEYLDVVDLKGGKGVLVEATDNDQLKTYALGVHHDFGWLFSYKKVRLHIVQPRKDNYDTFELSVDELEQFAETVKETVLAGLNPEAPLVDGKKQCTFCRADQAADCPAKVALAYRIAADDFAEEEAGMSLQEMHDLASRVQSWAKAALNRVKTEMLNGTPVEGLKVVQGRSSYVFADSVVATAKLTEEEIFNAFEPQKLKSVAKVKAALKAEGWTKKEIDAFVAAMVVKKPGKPTIAPESDKRAAVTPEALAALDFSDEEEDENADE